MPFDGLSGGGVFGEVDRKFRAVRGVDEKINFSGFAFVVVGAGVVNVVIEIGLEVFERIAAIMKHGESALGKGVHGSGGGGRGLSNGKRCRE